MGQVTLVHGCIPMMPNVVGTAAPTFECPKLLDCISYALPITSPACALVSVIGKSLVAEARISAILALAASAAAASE